ncbi:P-loop NTPase [Ornithinimicrobium humiphilum]|uniref:MinD-like ATPase involved in chromosome partitioning or flagellar assembly n=1 Tax=Ornithinimicrobium humiphilum TaxID=125288 RepID=A0A543KMG9_9MICO|nr:hypothetical protein [Ornithinimicrobium humiphilum]TQM96266.1 MinD-like ATPase involved in chromosome partitioning or flagellar assembly [Ornithinimicrobium humiphilum]
MSLPLVTGVAPRWEAALAGALASAARVHVVRRCADVPELVGTVAAGLGRVVVVSSDLRGLDRAALDALREHGALVLGVHPPGDEAGSRGLARWGVGVTVPADAPVEALDAALDRLLDADAPAASRPVDPERAVGTGDPDHEPPGTGPDAHRPPPAAVVVSGAPAPEDAEGPDPEESPDHAEGAAPVRASPDDEEPGRVVAVWGPTGAPGRTTVAVNLAAELADPLHPVLLVDADTYGASVAQTLALLDEVPGIAAAARAADQGTLDRDTLARLAPEVRPGLRVLTGLPRADRWPELRDVALADVLEQCRSLAPTTVVDVAAPLEQDEELSFDTLAPRRNGAALTALDAADRVVVVGTADPVGLQRLVRGLDQLAACTHAERTVVVTRVRPGPVGPDPGRRIQEALDRFASTGPVHLVPEDQDALDMALLHGRVLAEVRPRSPARLALVELAGAVAGRAPARARAARRPVLGWLAGRRAAAL